MVSIALRVAPYLIALLLVVGGYLYVARLHEKVTEQEVSLRQKEEEVGLLRQQVEDLSTQRSEVESALRLAEIERNRIRSDLNRTLSKMRAQKPPLECKDAIGWAVDNKGDLAW